MLTPLLRQIFLVLVHLSLERLSKVFEGNDHHSDVVKTAFGHGRFQYGLNSCPTVLMNRLASVLEILLGGFPARLHDLGVGQFVIDAIASKYYKVIVIFHFKALNVWRRNDNFRIALVFSSLGFNVTEGSRHG